METEIVTVTAKDVMTLRQKTGLGMMDCKNALTQNDGDMAAAEEWIRAKRKGKMDTRTERTTGEGRIGIAIDQGKAVIVEVLTETDFTARNDAFVEMVTDIANLAMEQDTGDVSATDAMTTRIDDIRIVTGENAHFGRGMRYDGGSYGQYVHHDGKRACLLQVAGDVPDDALKGICQHIVFYDPTAISEADVPSETLESIRTTAQTEAKTSGKNDEIAQKIADGKVRKYLEENTLLAQKYVLDETTTIGQLLPEGASITAFTRYTLGS
jgi:elongation factor Ts